eukprot:6165540-Prorocentrum_lima.AAC.1
MQKAKAGSDKEQEIVKEGQYASNPIVLNVDDVPTQGGHCRSADSLDVEGVIVGEGYAPSAQ